MNGKTHLAVIAIIASLTAAAPIAIAQQRHHQTGAGGGMQSQQPPGGMMGRGMMGPGMMGRGMMMGGCPMIGGDGETFAKGRIAFLKAELGITDEQKAAFDAYAGVLNDNFENMRALHQSMMEMMSAESPVARLDLHLTMMESRLTALKAIKPKIASLYAALSDEQKQKADRLLTGMGCMM